MNSRTCWLLRVVLFVPFALASVAGCYAQSQASVPYARTSKANGAAQSSTAQNNTIHLPVLGSGTTNSVPLWTGRQFIGNSILSQVPGGVNIAGSVTGTSFFGDGSHLINVNALTLQGLSPSAFVQTGTSNNFTGDQTITGNLNLTGLLNSAFTAQGNLTDASGEQGANLIGGFAGGPGYGGNSIAPGVIGATIAGGGGLVVSVPPPLPGLPGRRKSTRSNTFSLILAPNLVSGNWGTVGGGALQSATGNYSVVAGGYGNAANADYSTVSGGYYNTASQASAFVGGGEGNTASGIAAVVAAGIKNTASGDYSVLMGGYSNVSTGSDSALGGGSYNSASGLDSVVAGGFGNVAAGKESTVAGGIQNQAFGQASFAAGTLAFANYDGSFVWGDASSQSYANDTAANQFVARASGGLYLYTASDLSTGAILPSGSGSWNSLSDRNVKENFSDVDGKALLNKLAAMPILTWNYKAQANSIRHIGPMAQDFREAFNLGEDEKHISTVDAQGVALAAIQALYKLTQEKDKTIAELRDALLEQHRVLERLETRVANVERTSGKHASPNALTLAQSHEH